MRVRELTRPFYFCHLDITVGGPAMGLMVVYHCWPAHYHPSQIPPLYCPHPRPPPGGAHNKVPCANDDLSIVMPGWDWGPLATTAAAAVVGCQPACFHLLHPRFWHRKENGVAFVDTRSLNTLLQIENIYAAVLQSSFILEEECFYDGKCQDCRKL